MTVTTVATNEQAIALAKHLMDPYRDRVAVVVSMTTQRERRYDAELIARETNGCADVYVMEPGRVNLTFSDYLPEQKTVFGGATRIYGKGTDWMRNFHSCPLYFAYTSQEAEARVGGLIDRAFELSYIGLNRVAAVAEKEPQLAEEIAAHAKTISAPSPLALMGGRVSVVNAPVAAATATSEERAATPVEVTVDSTIDGSGEDPRDEQIKALQDELTVQQFRYEQLEHEHREEIAGMRARAKSELRKIQQGGPSVKMLIEMRTRIIDMQAQMQQAETANGRELVDVRVENAELRRKLAEQDEQHRTRMAAARKKATKAQSDDSATAWTPDLFASDEDAVRHAILVTWAQRVPAHDKATYPLPAYTVGRDFADSLNRLDTGHVNKALRCAVDVLTGLGTNTRNIHVLRQGETSDSAPRTRDDGAICFRAYVEQNVASARRLHYWKHDNGHLELARVVLHDDMSA